MNVLVVAPAWIGDMVMAQSLFRVLTARMPGVRIEVLAPRATAPLTARMPEVAATHEAPFAHGELAFLERRRLGRRLCGRFDWAIVLPNSWKSALVPFFARVSRRTGFVGELRYGLLNDPRRLEAMRWPRMVQRFAALARAAGAADDGDPPTPCLVSSPAATAGLRVRLGLTGGAPVLALCPGAEYGRAKRWPAEHFARVANHHLRDGYQVWLLGGVGDAPLANAIVGGIDASGARAVANLAGKTTLLDAVDLLSAAARVVSNDSGLMHVAAALGVPVVGVFGSSSPAFTPPLGARAAAVSLALPCSPCYARTCRFGHYDCLTKLGPERVLAALARVADAA